MGLQPVRPTVKTSAQAFTGDVYMTPIYNGQDPSRMTVALVASLRKHAPTGTPTPSARPSTSPKASA
jgi:hypothetical protein